MPRNKESEVMPAETAQRRRFDEPRPHVAQPQQDHPSDCECQDCLEYWLVKKPVAAPSPQPNKEVDCASRHAVLNCEPSGGPDDPVFKDGLKPLGSGVEGHARNGLGIPRSPVGRSEAGTQALSPDTHPSPQPSDGVEELVKELRDSATFISDMVPNGERWANLRHKAADLIQRLDAENDALAEQSRIVTEQDDMIDDLQAELAKVTAERDLFAGEVAEQELQLAAAREEVKRLRTIFEPLVAACEGDFTSDATEVGDGRCSDCEAVSDGNGGPSKLTFGTIRKARQALAQSGGK